MNDNLYRLESAVSATASGNLTWERWPLDCAVALGLAGQRNPLGFAVVRYLSDPPSAMNTWNIILVLAKEMQLRGVVADGLKDAALRAFEVWKDTRCSPCGGRGVVAGGQQTCKVCDGTGQRRIPEGDESLTIGYSCLLEAERWMEGQLRARMRGMQYASEDATCRINLDQRIGNLVQTGGNAATFKAPHHE